MVKEIVKIGAEVLRETAIPAENNENTKQIIQDLKDTLSKTSNGAGLAAPQIGESKRIFVTKNYKENSADILVFINPEIIEESEETVPIADGCLSIPGVHFTTNRNSFIKVKYLNEDFEEVEEEFQGFQSVVFQHENDHLDGILFIDKVEDIDSELIKEYFERKEKGENVLLVDGKIVEIKLDFKNVK